METTSLIKRNDFEDLVQTYKAKSKAKSEEIARKEEYNQEVNSYSARNTERKDIIARQVQEAYIFLSNAGKLFSDMTVEEFEIAHEEMRKRRGISIETQEEELANLWFFRPWKIRSLKKEIRGHKFSIEHGYNWNVRNNKLSAMVDLVGIIVNGFDWTKQLPLNLKDLVHQIFEIRFGTASERHLKFEKGGE